MMKKSGPADAPEKSKGPAPKHSFAKEKNDIKAFQSDKLAKIYDSESKKKKDDIFLEGKLRRCINIA